MAHATLSSLLMIHFEMFFRLAVYVLELSIVQMSDMNRLQTAVALVMVATTHQPLMPSNEIKAHVFVGVPGADFCSCPWNHRSQGLDLAVQVVLVAGRVHTSNDTLDLNMQVQIFSQDVSWTAVSGGMTHASLVDNRVNKRCLQAKCVEPLIKIQKQTHSGKKEAVVMARARTKLTVQEVRKDVTPAKQRRQKGHGAKSAVQLNIVCTCMQKKAAVAACAGHVL